MRRDEVVYLLRRLKGLRETVERMDAALEELTECEREIIEKMVANPVPHASEKICEMFGIEMASVYRRRNKALKKLEIFMDGDGREKR